MYVCIYLSIYVCMYLCMYVCMYACNVCIYICVCICMCICSYICICSCIWICSFICVFVTITYWANSNPNYSLTRINCPSLCYNFCLCVTMLPLGHDGSAMLAAFTTFHCLAGQYVHAGTKLQFLLVLFDLTKIPSISCTSVLSFCICKTTTVSVHQSHLIPS